jgi:outer membrane autotransporter protein
VASLDNNGTLVAAAYADGGIAHAYGVGLLGGFGATITNAGDITAIANADQATATGVFAAAPYGSVDVTNAGTILAAAYGPDATAIGLRMESGGVNTLVNTGTIAALGDGARYAITSGAGAQAVLGNQGTLVGAITTAELDDTLDNAAGALWRALGTSDFGAGADSLANAGTLRLENATIRLGTAAEGDTFANTGLIVVAGDDNAIELPGAAFTNDGVVSFLDLATGDNLSLLGDLGGNGSLLFDASGRTLASDRLYVDGNVTGTQVIDVNLLDAPTAASTLIPLVFVSGDSTAGSFTLGNVATGGAGFLSLDFHLDAAIDASNANADVFSLGMDVTGLNDAGALASVLDPGVQGVVDAQVGTWRQRSGAPRGKRDGVLEPWLRVFADGGDFTPTHAGIGTDGTLGYHQSNRGWELGLDTRPSGKLALGLLIASSEGSQQLDAGPGRADLDARTFGVYGTWLGERFYLDASQRWVGVDARLGAKRTEATASVFNLEAGYTGWSVGELNVVPQVQYTHSRIGDVTPIRDGASTFQDDGGLSSRVRLGVALDRTFSAGGYALTPSATLNAVRELDGDYDHTINGALDGTTSIAGTSTQVELGLDARKGRLSIGGSVHWTDGGAVDGRTGGQLTVRYRW